VLTNRAGLLTHRPARFYLSRGLRSNGRSRPNEFILNILCLKMQSHHNRRVAQPFNAFDLSSIKEISGAPSLRFLHEQDAMLPMPPFLFYSVEISAPALRKIRKDGAPLILIVQRRSKAGPSARPLLQRVSVATREPSRPSTCPDTQVTAMLERRLLCEVALC